VKQLVALACPTHQELVVQSDQEAYVCPRGCRYPIVSRIPRFVPATSYADSFGLQWNAFRRTQLDSFTGTTLSRDRLARIAGGSLDAMRAKTVLEAGCGAGRFTEVMLAAGARVFAFDLSSAVEANLENCGHFENYFVCQADVQCLPVLPGTFDVVVCVGVIQHTPDPEKTIEKLCSYVRPGGWLYIDHYPPDYPTTPSRRALRWLLLRTSPRFALGFCSALVRLLWPIHRWTWRLLRAPGTRLHWWARKVTAALLYLSPVVDYQWAYSELGPQLLRTWALLDTHDTLTDRFKHLRSESQICTQLAKCGMVDVHTQLGGNGIEARARRP
jgi:SAM-dependent methyltransferase